MKDRASRVFALLTAVTVAALLALVLLAHAALAQEEAPRKLDAPSLRCSHDLSRLSTFDKLRLLPAEILSVENGLVEWRATGADEIRLGSAVMSEDTLFVRVKDKRPEALTRDEFAKTAGTKAEWSLLLCSRCRALIAARRDR